MNETCPCCNAPMRGSDHCWFCGCEQYERYCDATYDGSCPELCWTYRHFDYCQHTEQLTPPTARDIELEIDAMRLESLGE